MQYVAVVALVLAGSVASTSQVFGQGRGRGKEDKAKAAAPAAAPAPATLSVVFSPAERKIIADYYAAHRYTPERLPPGIAKNLARGKPLPPGIARKQPPAELITLLPKRVGVEVTVFGDRVVLIEASGVVVDVLEGVFR